MERTSPKRIRINAVVLEAQQLILAEGGEVSVKEAADREKIETRTPHNTHTHSSVLSVGTSEQD